MNSALSSFVAAVLLVAACGVAADTLATRSDPVAPRTTAVAKRIAAAPHATLAGLPCCASAKPESTP